VIAKAAAVDVGGLNVVVIPDVSKARTATSTDGDATVSMGWGYNPFSTEAKVFQGGVRADPFCLTTT